MLKALKCIWRKTRWAEIARIEWYREGRVPLHSLRANIGYGVSHLIQHMAPLVLKFGFIQVKKVLI